MTNGTGWLAKTLIGGGITLYIGITSFTGKAIVDNREKAIQEHVEIRKELVDKHSEVKDIVTDIRVEQMEAMTILRRLDK